MIRELSHELAAALSKLLEAEAWDSSRSNVGDRVAVEVIRHPPRPAPPVERRSDKETER